MKVNAVFFFGASVLYDSKQRQLPRGIAFWAKKLKIGKKLSPSGSPTSGHGKTSQIPFDFQFQYSFIASSYQASCLFPSVRDVLLSVLMQ